MNGDDFSGLPKPDSKELQALIERAKGDLPSGAQLESLATRLGPILGAGIPPSTPGTGSGIGSGSAKVAGKIGAAKLAGLGAAGVAVVGAAWLMLHPTPELQHTAPSVSVPHSSIEQAAPEPPTASGEIGDAPAVAPSASKAAPSARTPSHASEKRAAPPAAEAKPISETSLLEAARSIVKSDPRRALALTEEHRRRFPNGVLAQEREVLAIEALSALGRSDAAETRARDFGRQYPGSAHEKKIEAATKH